MWYARARACLSALVPAMHAKTTSVQSVHSTPATLDSVTGHFTSTAGLPVSYKSGPPWGVAVTRSEFKSETIFGFLSPDYSGQRT